MDGLVMKYFVLNPRGKTRCDEYAIASREAMRVYADQIENENAKLAKELRKWANKETKKQNEDHPF